jgi:hypothetical protein
MVAPTIYEEEILKNAAYSGRESEHGKIKLKQSRPRHENIITAVY